MARFDGSLALKLDFGEATTTTTAHTRVGRRRLWLAAVAHRESGPDKYRALDHRRRQAQIRARRLLDLTD